MGFIANLLGILPKKPPVHITDENFQEEVMRSKLPVVLDVWGPNCRPCKQLEPIIMELAAAYDGKVKVCELNAADAPQSASRMQVRGTPTVIYLNRGRELERVVGMRSSVYHRETIDELFKLGES